MCWFGLSWAPHLIAAAVPFSLESEILLKDMSVSDASTYTVVEENQHEGFRLFIFSK